MVPDIQETHDRTLTPQQLVKHNAKRKAQAIAQRLIRGVVVSADTVVVAHGRVFGKPRDRQEAKQMLRELNGIAHRVYTGVCTVDVERRRMRLDVASTFVHMRQLSPRQIDWYVHRVPSLDKAGAYAVQDLQGMLIDRLQGSLSNVVGLPLHVVARRLRECGVLR